MKLDRLLFITKTSVKENKTRTILLSIFLIISLTISFLLIAFSIPMQHNIENKVNNHIINRTGSAMVSDENMIDNIKNVSHVVDVYEQNNDINTKMQVENFTVDTKLTSPFKQNDLIIINGRNIKPNEKNVVVIPETMYGLRENASGKTKIDTSILIGKTIEFPINNGATFEAEIVGTYSINDLMYFENCAYISYEQGRELQQSDIFGVSNYIVEIDNYKNKESTFEEIKKNSLDLPIFEALKIDKNIATNSLFIQFSLLIALFIVVVTMFTSKIFISSFIKSRLKEVALLKSMGYSNSQLLKILIFEYGLVLTFTSIIGVIIAILSSLLIIDPILKSNLQYTALKMNMDLNPLIFILIYILIFIMIFISCFVELRKTKKFNLFSLLYD